jgi:hypothetical protein
LECGKRNLVRFKNEFPAKNTKKYEKRKPPKIWRIKEFEKNNFCPRIITNEK